jgi:hypothetical protein
MIICNRTALGKWSSSGIEGVRTSTMEQMLRMIPLTFAISTSKGRGKSLALVGLFNLTGKQADDSIRQAEKCGQDISLPQSLSLYPAL